MLGRLFGKTVAAEDPLLQMLSGIHVPMPEAGSFVDGYEIDHQQTGLVKAKDDRSGAVAQYQVQWNRPRARISAQLAANDLSPFVQWVRQLVVLLTDADAASRWFTSKSNAFEGYQGRIIGGFRYGQVQVVPAADIGDEAALLSIPNDEGSTHFVDAYVILRSGRLFGSVGCSNFMDMRVESDLKLLAAALAGRMKTAEDSEPKPARG